MPARLPIETRWCLLWIKESIPLLANYFVLRYPSTLFFLNKLIKSRHTLLIYTNVKKNVKKDMTIKTVGTHFSGTIPPCLNISNPCSIFMWASSCFFVLIGDLNIEIKCKVPAKQNTQCHNNKEITK